MQHIRQIHLGAATRTRAEKNFASICGKKKKTLLFSSTTAALLLMMLDGRDGGSTGIPA
ncbi:hypothetical protein IF1G_09286 [Cordyceps javanica]|uniref:Uncharacterized protein n=1 Tax=Cordyceps javanica TaxID=43265 RepID=A0A545URX1_9HYPO|nr:hypothetical protein IF1G_09286 [Cordyceps javanica]TQW04000.1 hypothetical protein IF2G_08314 [Cordyceps javanica]